MPRPLIVSWYYALKALPHRMKHKAHLKIWWRMVKRGYYRLTPDERVQAMTRMFDELKKSHLKNMI